MKETAQAGAQRDVSARKALLKPLKYRGQSEIRATVRKLQRLGKAQWPNDPSLT